MMEQSYSVDLGKSSSTEKFDHGEIAPWSTDVLLDKKVVYSSSIITSWIKSIISLRIDLNPKNETLAILCKLRRKRKIIVE